MTFQWILRAAAVSLWLLLVLAACASPGSQINKVLQHPDYVQAGFKNVLVVGVADDYDARAHFERQVVSGIRAAGAAATAYYTVIGHNPAITSSDINNAVRARQFDAVLLTRVKNQSSEVSVQGSAPEGKATRMDGNAIDLFRYDYEELNEPATVAVSSSMVLVTELFAAAEQKVVWAIESTSFNYPDIYQLIDAEAQTIVGRLRQDGMISR